MSEWDLPIVEYWDQERGAINNATRRLLALSEEDRIAACNEIRSAVTRRLDALDDDLLLKASVSMVDDLYKYVNDEVLFDRALLQYLEAFGRAFTSVVHDRGYVIRYVVENQFSGVDYLMLGPFDLFPKIFNAAGFVYICPQHLALRIMKGDGVAASDYESAIDRYIAEARTVAERLLTQCQEEGLHYIFLETDYQEGALDAAVRGNGSPGVLGIFRDDAPVAGTSVSIRFPPEK
jgi:hypothetical protein